MLSLGQNLKVPKRCEKRLFDLIKVVVCKKTLQKTPNIGKKREHFENGQSRPRCMGYSPCKMLSMGQKLKCLKGAKNDCASTLKRVLMGLTVNRQMGRKLTVNRQKRNIFTVNRQMSEPKLAVKFLRYP